MDCCLTEGQKLVVVIGAICGIASFVFLTCISIKVVIEQASESKHTREKRKQNRIHS